MKLFTFLFFFLTFSSVYSQSRPYFGIEIQPKLSTYLHSSDNAVEANGRIGYSIAGHTYIDLGSTLSFKTGISLNSLRLNLRDYTPILSCDFDATSGTADIKNSYNDFEFPLAYLGIPAQIKWATSEAEKHLYLKFGVETLFRLSSKGKHKVVECGTNTLTIDGTIGGLNSILIVSGFGVGYELPLKENKKLYIEPSVEYSLSTFFNDENPVILGTLISTSGNLFNIGLAAGILF